MCSPCIESLGFPPRKGQQYVKTWMQKNFNVTVLGPQQQMSDVLGNFAKFTAEVGSDGGTVQPG